LFWDKPRIGGLAYDFLMMEHKRALLVSALTLSAGLTLAAPPPSTPGSVLERSRESREFLEQQRRLRLPEEAPEPEIIDGTEQPAPPAPASDVRFLLQAVRFSPSELLGADELRDIADDYVGREVTVADLFALVEAINVLYRARQVIAAKAVLPPQRIDKGIVQIMLVEGSVGAIDVEGNQDTRETFITDGLESLQLGRPVFLDQLESDLFYFNAVNDIDLRAVLKPGETFATTDYVLQVVEPSPYENTFFVDDAGRDDVGLYRIGFSHFNRSLSGLRDTLSVGGHIAEGTRALYGAYNVPLNSRGTRLGISADYSAIDIIDGPLEPLEVTGNSFFAGLFLTHPLRVRRTDIVNGFVGYSFKESSTDFEDATLVETYVRSLTAGADIQKNLIDQSWFGRATLTGAPDTWGNTKAFWRANAELSRLQVLPKNQVLLLRGRGQWSPDDLLPSSEQFQIGGMSTVRGYPEGLLIGDKGYFLSAEFSFPLDPADAADPSANPFEQRWRGILFVDHGGAFPFKGNDESIDDDDFLTSVGGGINLDLGPQLQARLVVGFPLSSRDDGEDDPRLHFYLQSQPF
jgi:hemolysin activation/secretion protein